MANNATRLTSLAVGAMKSVVPFTFGAAVVLAVVGTQQVNKIEIINQQPVISATGAVAGSTTQYDYEKWMPIRALTQTGGLVKTEYEVFNWDFPESYTGAIMQFCIDVTTAATMTSAMHVDCGVLNDSLGTTSGTNLFDTESLTVGAHCVVPGSTEVTIGPNEAVICHSTSGTGVSLDADAWMKYRYTPLD